MQPDGLDVVKLYMRALVSTVTAITRRPALALVCFALITLAAASYTATHFRMNSDDSTLISQDEPFRRDFAAFIDQFPESEETTVIVITSPSIELADKAVDALRDALLARDDLIETVYAPSADEFFEDHGLLYLDRADLEDVIERLAEAQPALTALSEDPSLRGLFGQLELSLEELEDGGALPTGFERMANRIAEVTDSLVAGNPRGISWADEFLDQEGTVYRVLIVQGRKDFSETISTAHLIGGIRDTARQLGLTPENGVEVRLTGMVPLAHDEQETLQRGLALAAVIAFSLLTMILLFGVRSIRISFAAGVTLLTSITWTTAYAMFVVGEFNIISAAVMVIGLGVDFAIHLGLRYEEECRRGFNVPDAIVSATRESGMEITLCGLTSTIGFLSFVPTPYPGLAALGIIAGGGMMLALLASFTVFPAILALMRAPSPQYPIASASMTRISSTIARNPRAWVGLGAAITVVAAVLSLRMSFDFSTLSMRDPDSESIVTLRDLQREDIVTDYSAVVLAPDRAAAERIALELEALATVSEARAPSYYVPGEQDEKLLMLEDAAFFLEPVISPEPPRAAPSDAERQAAFDSLRARLASLSDPAGNEPLWQSIRRLRASLDAVADTDALDQPLAELERLVVSDLGERLDWLRRAITVEAVSFDDLPEDTRRRVVAPDGTTQVVALPRDDLSDTSALKQFIEEVATISPNATGRPAVEAGIGRIVVQTFEMAIAITVVCIFLLLWVTLGRIGDAVVAMVPITLAGLITTAFGVVAGIPFNMTNVIVIPLMFGLGVDSAIHVVVRYRHDGSVARVMESSTPRAVVLTALTTLASFGSLVVSQHRGMRSLGILLSVALLSLLFSTLVLLPAWITLRREPAGNGK